MSNLEILKIRFIIKIIIKITIIFLKIVGKFNIDKNLENISYLLLIILLIFFLEIFGKFIKD